jgi:uncharacterized protein YecT (DUF1311 family)
MTLTADKRLNADVKLIFDTWQGGAAQRDFVAAQAAWAKYRQADCNSQSDVYQGGSEQPVVFIYCLASDDTARHQELKVFYKELTQGDTKAPAFP